LRRSLPEFHSSRLDRVSAKAVKGAVLARHEGDFRKDAEEPLSLNELLTLLGNGATGEARSREDAIACYLSASEGWREAMKQLGGAFANGETGLKDHKAD